MATIKEDFKERFEEEDGIIWIYDKNDKGRPATFEDIEKFIKEREIAEYRQGYNDCLKDQKLTGEENQRLYL